MTIFQSIPQVEPARCTGCGWCVAVCRPHALSLEQEAGRKRAVLHAPQACTDCGKCERRCPHAAINMTPPCPGGTAAGA